MKLVLPAIRTRAPAAGDVLEASSSAASSCPPAHLRPLRTSGPASSAASEDVRSEQDEVCCLSPLSQHFMNCEQPPDIYATMQLEGRCGVEELVRPMQRMADLHDRFRRRVVYRFGAWQAEVLEDFDVRSLMREVELDGPDAQQAFDDYMGKLMSGEPLGAQGALPPWDVHCIRYACDPRRTDVLMRASHVIGDGQLFMKLIKQIMDPMDAAAEADYAATVLGDGGAARARRGGGGGLGDSSSCSSMSGAGRDDDGASSVSDASGACGSDDGSCVSCEQEAAPPEPAAQQQRGPRRRSPQEAAKAFFRALWGLLVMCWRGYTALVFTAVMPFWFADPVTGVKASPDECRGARRWASASLSLPEFHRTARLLGRSINALAASCLAGGVRRYLLRHGERPAARVRLCSMVDTRSMPALLTGADGSSSNNFSFIAVPLFTGECGPLARLARVDGALRWIRHSLAVPLAIRMPPVIQFIFRDPAWSTWAMLRCLPFKTTVGFSNMRGPSGSWALSGHPVLRIHNGVQPNAFGCFVSLFSYNDVVTFTHTCYETKSKDPQALLECILEEYRALRKAAAVGAGAGRPGSDAGSPRGDRIKAA